MTVSLVVCHYSLLCPSVHVVFGQVCGGAALVRQLEALPVDRNARPLQDVLVAACGQLVRVERECRKQIDVPQDRRVTGKR